MGLLVGRKEKSSRSVGRWGSGAKRLSVLVAGATAEATAPDPHRPALARLKFVRMHLFPQL
jgi:hypothetical protein